MIKLLRANFSRLKTEKIFWFAAGFTALYALVVCMFALYSEHVNQSEIAFDALFVNCYGLLGYLSVPGIVMAAFCSLYIGTEFSDGTIRNKLVVGHTRTEIYLANFLTCALTGIFFSLIFIAILCAVGLPLFGLPGMSAKMLALLILAGTMMIVSYAALLNLLSMLLGNKASAAIVSLISVIAVMFLCTYLIGKLHEPPFIQVISDFSINGVSSSSQTIPNPQYVTEPARTVLQTIADLLPSGQSLQISGTSAPHLWRLPVYAAGLTAVANAAGILLFRKKDLK